MPIPPLNELCDVSSKKPRKTYPHFLDTPTYADEDHQTLVVNLRALDAALCGDPVWASSERAPDPERFKMIKYGRAMHEIQTEKPIYMPWLTFSEGRTRLMDGRHRLYALMDEGYTHVSVVFSPQITAIVRTLADPEDLPAI